jgi:hypothetical protein
MIHFFSALETMVDDVGDLLMHSGGSVFVDLACGTISWFMRSLGDIVLVVDDVGEVEDGMFWLCCDMGMLA